MTNQNPLDRLIGMNAARGPEVNVVPAQEKPQYHRPSSAGNVSYATLDDGVINNTQFYRAVEVAVQQGMKEFETMYLLPRAESLAKELGVKVGSYPIEGYYGENPVLTRFFMTERSLQDSKKFTPKVTESLRKYHTLRTHPALGIKQGSPSGIEGTNVMYPNEPKQIVPSMADALTVACYRVPFAQWTIDKVMGEVDLREIGTTLVGLGAKVDDMENQNSGNYNPVATTMARWTTVLTAMKAGPRGIPSAKWRVNREVEEYGNRVIDAYNDMFAKAGASIRIPYVTKDTAPSLLQIAGKPERTVNIAVDNITGRKDKYYHWQVVGLGNRRYKVNDFWSNVIKS